MIWRFILHIEWHRGYRPHISLRRAARHGDRVKDGGERGILKNCPQCSGTGHLFHPDRIPQPVWPSA